MSSSPQSLSSSSSSSSTCSDTELLVTNRVSYAFRILDHVKLGPTLSETVKGKVRLGAQIIKDGGRHNIFKNIFGLAEGEQLLKASQCYLSTSAGPIAGLLFISTQKIAFSGQTPLAFRSSKGHLITTPYKVMIPVKKIKRASQSENVENPAKKYIKIVTKDNFEFWFMGFLRYESFHESREGHIHAYLISL